MEAYPLQASALEASKAARARREAEQESGTLESEQQPGEAETADGRKPESVGGAAEPEETAERSAERRATVVCAEDQLSLAIGRSGQNVRLASKLTGYKIDLVSKQEYLAKEEEILFGRKPEPVEVAGTEAMSDAGGEDFPLNQVPGVTPEAVAALAAAGYRTFEDIINLEREDLLGIADIDDATVEVLMRMIDELTVEVDEEWDEESGEYVESPTEIESASASEPAPEELDAGADMAEGSEKTPSTEAAPQEGDEDGERNGG